MHYSLQALEWGAVPFRTGRIDVIGNVMRGGQSTREGLPLLMIGGDGDLEHYEHGNIAVDWKGDAPPERGRFATGRARFIDAEKAMPLPADLPVMAAEDVERFVLANAAEGRGEIIDSQARVGGYPTMAPTSGAFDPALWDLETMLPNAPEALDSGNKSRGT